MRYNIIISVFFVLATSLNIYAQTPDSTSNFKLYPLESVSAERTFDGEVVFKSESRRSSLLILDEQIRRCLLTVILKEYKFGKKITESSVFSKVAINDNSMLSQFEDSSMLFSLYRKHNKDNQFIWGFRLPTTFHAQAIQLDDKEESYVTVAIPQNYLNNKIPLGTQFPLLVITLPDKTGNFPFYRPENKYKYPVADWNYRFQLNHTFVIELLIEKIDNTNLSNKGHSL